MSQITLDQIPPDMKTQLGNMLAQKRKKKEIKTYSIKYIEKIVSQNYPQTRSCICEITINYFTEKSYQVRLESQIFSKKSDAERQAAYYCYQQILYDFQCDTSPEEVDSSDEVIRTYRKSNKYERKSSGSSVDSYDSDTQKEKKRTLAIYPLSPVVQPAEHHLFHIYILIDVENKPNDSLITQCAKKYSNVTVLRFVGKNHPNRKKGNIIVDSHYKDAADHAITMYVGGLVQSIEIPFDIIVYTGDRFGSALQEFCKFSHVKVYHMAHQEDVITHISHFKVIDNEGELMLD